MIIARSSHLDSRGFTLVEMLITVAIIAILASIVVPSYYESVKKARRSDAKTSLLSFAAAMERYNTRNGSYIGAGNGVDAKGIIPDADVFPSEAPLSGQAKFYDLRVTLSTVTYTLFAIPKGVHEGDGTLRIDAKGEQAWDKDDNGNYNYPWP